MLLQSQAVLWGPGFKQTNSMRPLGERENKMIVIWAHNVLLQKDTFRPAYQQYNDMILKKTVYNSFSDYIFHSLLTADFPSLQTLNEILTPLIAMAKLPYTPFGLNFIFLFWKTREWEI